MCYNIVKIFNHILPELTAEGFRWFSNSVRKDIVYFTIYDGVDMKIKVNGRKVNLKDNFIALVEKKLAKFDRIFDEDSEATVTVTLERNRQTVEITINQRGMFYRAESTELEMNDALDNVVSKLGRQIRKNKTRLENNKKVQKIEFVDDYYDEPEDEFNIVRTKKFFVEVMTVEEAILQMNLLGHEFFMFRSDDSGETCVVYKRKDGNYGLLESKKV